MAIDNNYIIVTPVRNEEKYIEKSISSVISQTIRPTEWIIVNDGSTDRTREIIARYSKEFSWIKRIDRKNQGFRETGAKVVEAFNDGFGNVSANDWNFVVKLDGDLSFDRDYFENLIGKFHEDKRLGIASGVYLELDKAGTWRQVRMPLYHTAGACKMVRRNCYEEIGGFFVSAGWDTVDEIRAITRGWVTRHFSDLRMKHHKPEGSGIGMLKTSVMHGEIFYLTGGDRLFFALKALKRAGAKPYFVGSLALCWGYVRTALEGRALIVNEAEAHCYKTLLRERLRLSVRKLIVRNQNY